MHNEETQQAKVVKTEALNPQAKALLKAAENMLVGSLDTIKDFAKVMITLVSGLFATYFAILNSLEQTMLQIKRLKQSLELRQLRQCSSF